MGRAAFRNLPSKRFTRRCSSERGSAFVEFILTLPIVISLLFGTLSVGFAIYTHQKNALVARELANIVLRRCPQATSEALMSECLAPAVSEILSVAPALLGPNAHVTLRYGRCSFHECVACSAPPCTYDGSYWVDANGEYLIDPPLCSYSSSACSCTCGESPDNPSLVLGDLVLGGMIMTPAGTTFTHSPDDIGRLYEDIWAGTESDDQKASMARQRFWNGDQEARGNSALMTERGFAIEIEVATDFIQPRPWNFGILRAHEEVVF